MENIKKVSFYEIKMWSFEKYGEINTLLKDITVGQFVSYLFSAGHLTPATLRKVQKVKLQTTVGFLGDTPISHINKEVLNDAFSELGVRREHVKVYRNSFKRVVLRKAVELSLLDKDYDYYFMSRKLRNHKKTRTLLLPKDRTVGWYVCEVCHNDTIRGKGTFIHASGQTRLKKIFYPVWDKKIKDFSLDWIDPRYTQGTPEARTPIELAISDGVLKDTEIFEAQEKGLILIDGDVWTVPDGIRQVSKLNFATLDGKTIEKRAMKLWMRDRIEQKLKGHAKYKNLVEKHFLKYLDDKGIALEDFSNTHKRKWVSWLKQGILQKDSKCGTIRNALSCTKQFITFLWEAESGILKKNISWLKEKDQVKCDYNKKSTYSSWEIQAIVAATKSDKDRLFSLAFALIMLTAKRLEEILTLKRDCIVDIAGIKCLKYTNHKLNKEETLALPSSGSEIEINLFKKSSGEQIVEIIETINKMTKNLARVSPKRYQDNLLLVEIQTRNHLGYNITPLGKSSYYSKLYAFKKRNRINFKLEAHKFRHTIASAAIRSGKGIESAATILGNKPKTVARYYEADISKEETLALGENAALDVRAEAERLINNKAPEVLSDTLEGDFAAVVPGGVCMSGSEAMMKCKYYNRLFGSGGCLGCSQLATTKGNKFYYEDLKIRIEQEFEETRGTPFVSSTEAKLKLVSKTLQNIDDAGGLS